MKGTFLPWTWGFVFRALTWGYPEVGGHSEGACPSGQQDSLVAGLQNDGHTQIHASIRGQLSPHWAGLLAQGRKRAERGSLAGGSRWVKASEVGRGLEKRGDTARREGGASEGGRGFQNWETPCDREGVGSGRWAPPAPRPYLRPFPRPAAALLLTWSGSLAEAPGNGLAERRSCPRCRPQCVSHGPSSGPAPRRPHTLCAKLTDSGRPDRSSSTRAAAITWLRVAAARSAPSAGLGAPFLGPRGERKPGFLNVGEIWA